MNGFKCSHHPERMALWICTSCQGHFCDECISTQRVGGLGVLQSCSVCGGKCNPVSFSDAAEKKEQAQSGSFYAQLPTAFLYPFVGSGKIMMIVGVIFFGILKFLSFIPLIGLIFSLIGTGYFMAFMFRIINSTAAGNKEMPDWPDLPGNIINPLLIFLGVLFVSFGPAVIFLFLFFYFHNALFLVPFIFFLLAGSFYYPMAMLAAALGTNLHFHPVCMTRSIFRVIKPYLVAFLVLGLIVVLNLLSGWLLMSFSLLLGFLFSGLVSFYLTIVEVRILGLIYNSYADRLEWLE